MERELTDKIALVTGAGSGIGRATALALAGAGAQVVVSDVVETGGHETTAAIQAAGGQAAFMQADISSEPAVAALAQSIEQEYGRLDIAVNNAGIGGRGANIIDYGVDDWHAVLNVNLHGVFYCLKHELPLMIRQSAGVVVNVASMAGLRGLANSAAYSASKHGVIGLTKSAALEVSRHNIRVNAVCPVFTRTPLFEGLFEAHPDYEEKLLRNIPLRRYAQPEDIAATILWLSSAAAEFMTGVAVPVDGGFSAQ